MEGTRAEGVGRKPFMPQETLLVLTCTSKSGGSQSPYKNWCNAPTLNPEDSKKGPLVSS